MAKRGLVIAASILAVAAVIAAVVVILHHHKPSATSSQQQARHVAITFHQACRATTHPKACEAAFAEAASENTSASGILRSAASFAAARLDAARAKVAESSAASGNQNFSRAAEACSELLEAAISRLEATAAALLPEQRGGRIRDARAWTALEVDSNIYRQIPTTSMQKL